ncbi:SixA phosphatase family protein [Maribacter sp. 2307ULW6-5]|uniref:SixA phosphatase family protein n=1 Tax=Maribacter sp. 2307ULW6-5 TaxID=3386275 RepID=UPI0039BC5ABF
MKEVIFMRHGKSSWEYEVGDQDRPLSQRGVHDAHLVGAALCDLQLPLDHFYSSPANRALHTCMICTREVSFPPDRISIVSQLYDFSGHHALEFLRSLDTDLQRVMVFGHNHAFTHLVNELGSVRHDNVPTSGLVHLRFDVGAWSALGPGGTTVRSIFPKEMR